MYEPQLDDEVESNCHITILIRYYSQIKSATSYKFEPELGTLSPVLFTLLLESLTKGLQMQR
jgi:hypothetical protein